MAAVHDRSTRTGSGFFERNAGPPAMVLGSLVVLAVVIQPSRAPAEPLSWLRRDPNHATSSRAARDDALKSIPFEQLDATARAKAAAVLRNVSFFRRMPIRVTQCDPDLYLFLVRHPDVIINIWHVLDVTKVTMEETGPGTFRMGDPAGTQGTVEFLYCDHDTLVIYTEGSYDGPLFVRPVKGRGLLLLKSGYVREPDGRYYVTSRLDAFMRVDHLGAEILAKTFQPLVGKVADINFTYTADFLGNLSRTAERSDDGLKRLASKLTEVRPQVRDEFAQLARRVAEKADELSRHDFDHPPQVASRAQAEATDSADASGSSGPRD
jgi:hypothetical protein